MTDASSTDDFGTKYGVEWWYAAHFAYGATQMVFIPILIPTFVLEVTGSATMAGTAMALKLKVPAPRINHIARERGAVTPDTALRLSRYFGTSPEFWMDLQTAFDLKIATKDYGGKIEAEISPRAA